MQWLGLRKSLRQGNPSQHHDGGASEHHGERGPALDLADVSEADGGQAVRRCVKRCCNWNKKASFARTSDADSRLNVHPPANIREIYPMTWTLEGLALRSSAVCAHLLVPELARINSEFANAGHVSDDG